jgi:DTW domain-containing protein
MPRAACICCLMPSVPTRTRVVVVMHSLESHKTTNTGRLALRCLPNSALVIRGDPEVRAQPPPSWHDGASDPVLLFPHPDARPLETWRDHARPVTLVVPDGTWRQAQRVRRRVPGLEGIPCASLAPTAPSGYHLRSTPHAGRLATIEAIAEALGVLEGAAPRTALLEIFHDMVSRTLRARGVS